MKIHIEKRTPAYWRVTLDNPPINLFDQKMMEELQALIDSLEQDEEVKVVVFDSANPEFFMAHLDLLTAADLKLDPGPTGLSPWPDFTIRLERAPFVTVGLLRGRARGVGSEFLQALDVRFASRKNGILSQIELGTGIIPGGGGLERLPLLVGRSRAIEIILGAEDFDADTAERYGWINRAIPDKELDAFVERFANRVASFDKRTIAATKEILNMRGRIATAEDLVSTQTRFFEILASPEAQSRVASLFQKGFQQRDMELNLTDYLV